MSGLCADAQIYGRMGMFEVGVGREKAEDKISVRVD